MILKDFSKVLGGCCPMSSYRQQIALWKPPRQARRNKNRRQRHNKNNIRCGWHQTAPNLYPCHRHSRKNYYLYKWIHLRRSKWCTHRFWPQHQLWRRPHTPHTTQQPKQWTWNFDYWRQHRFARWQKRGIRLLPARLSGQCAHDTDRRSTQQPGHRHAGS